MAIPLLGFSINFLFFGMNKGDERFNNLHLFESKDEIDVKYRKDQFISEGILYFFRIFSDVANFSKILDLIFEEISLHSTFLSELGLDEGINLEFFIEYNNEIEWTVQNQQLITLGKLTKNYPGISLNSINKNWKNEKKAFHQVIFHQLIFTIQNLYSDIDFIQKKWQRENLVKYKNHLSWIIETDDKKESQELQLCIKEDTQKFDWDEQYLDLLKFISKHLKPLMDKNIEVTYGFYQQNSSRISGGEIGYELVNEISLLGLDLRFTLKSKSPELINKI